MWTRAELKKRAKAFLKDNYWKAFLISLVIAIAQGFGGSGTSWREDSQTIMGNYPLIGHHPMMDPHIFIPAIIFASGAIVIVVILLRLFVTYPLDVGGRRYFIKSAEHKDSDKCFRFAYDGQNLKGIILTMLLKDIYNFLWFLLLIIPGIIKFYAYRMVPYILANNPNIGYKRAIELSIQMTNGQKFEIFVLDLSFIGWFLLGAIAFGVGILFVLPYYNATCAELYLALRKKALEDGFSTYQELRLEEPPGPDNPFITPGPEYI